MSAVIVSAPRRQGVLGRANSEPNLSGAVLQGLARKEQAVRRVIAGEWSLSRAASARQWRWKAAHLVRAVCDMNGSFETLFFIDGAACLASPSA